MPATTSSTLAANLRAAAELADQIDKLEKETQEKRRLMAQLMSNSAQQDPVHDETRMNLPGKNKTQSILEVLRVNKGKAMKASDIQQALGGVDLEVIRQLVNRLHKRGKIKRVAHGTYTLSA
jgi:hypothetical protein